MQPDDLLQQVLSAVSHVLWPVLWMAICVAGVILVRAGGRVFHFLMVIGAFLLFCNAVVHFALFNPFFGVAGKGEVEPGRLLGFVNAFGIVALLGLGMLAYGILADAMVRGRSNDEHRTLNTER